jgi:hypothetical protein
MAATNLLWISAKLGGFVVLVFRQTVCGYAKLPQLNLPMFAVMFSDASAFIKHLWTHLKPP